MLKYFSQAIPQKINTGGSKSVVDIQETIDYFLKSNKIPYQEYSYQKLRNIIHLMWPSPRANYLIFGYIGSPFFTERFPFVLLYFCLFWIVWFKKLVAREKFFLIVLDLIEWQSSLWVKKNNCRLKFLQILWCSMERLLVSHIADEVITNIDPEFIKNTYRTKCVHDLEVLDYYTKTDHELHNSSFNILYAGDLSRNYDIQLLVDILRNLNPKYKLLLAGPGLNGALKKELEKFENFSYLGQLETSELDEIARTCQFGLIVYPPDYLYFNIGSFIKTSFYIVNGLSIISTDLDRISYLNKKYNFGYVLEREKMVEMVSYLSPSMIKINNALQKDISFGKRLYSILSKLNLSS